jgi:osmotically-inducible protein OsmY
MKLAIATVATVLPLCVLADNSVANGMNDASTGVGDAVTDVAPNTTDPATANPTMMPPTTAPSDMSATVMPTDQSITTDVEAALKELMVNQKVANGTNLNVTVSNGVVTVTGTVMNTTDIDTVKTAISAVNGVKDINVDGVTVAGMQTNPMGY